MNEPALYAQPEQAVPEYAQTPMVKPDCHCAPDAPCRVSGNCKCISGLQKLLGNVEVKDE